MGVRGRLLAMIALVAGASTLATSYLFPQAMLSTLDDLDLDRARADATMLSHLVDEELDRLTAFAIDWGVWDDTLAYVRGEYPQYQEVNLEGGTLAGLGVDALAILGTDGEVHVCGAEDDDGGLVAAPPSFEAVLGTPGLGLDGPVTEAAAGAVSVGGETWLVAAGPVTDTEAEVPSEGTIVWGVLVDDALLDDLGTVFPRPPLLTTGQPPLDPAFADDHVRFGVALPMLAGDARWLATSRPRDALAAGGATALSLRWVQLVVGTLAAALFAWWLDRTFLRRLEALRHGVERVQRGVSDEHVEVTGSDEFARVARAINDMMDRVAAGQDELTRRNDELQQANSTRDAFVSMVSHELRTPLTSVLGFTETLRDRWDEVAPELRRPMLDRVHGQAKVLDGLVSDLLALRASDAAEGELGSCLVDAEVREVVAGFPEPLQDAIELHLDADGVRAPIGAEQLRRILSNLATNADKYGAPPIEIRTSIEGGEVVVDVCDHGPGVPTEFVHRLFEPFTQASVGDRRTAQGVGLGLSIVTQLATAVDGTVRYAARPGGGACFLVVLPIVAHEVAATTR